MVISGYCAWKALASFSPTGRSMEEYRTTLPSFLAASISAGVIGVRLGQSRLQRRGEQGQTEAAEPLTTSRLESFRFLIASSLFLLSA